MPKKRQTGTFQEAFLMTRLAGDIAKCCTRSRARVSYDASTVHTGPPPGMFLRCWLVRGSSYIVPLRTCVMEMLGSVALLCGTCDLASASCADDDLMFTLVHLWVLGNGLVSLLL